MLVLDHGPGQAQSLQAHQPSLAKLRMRMLGKHLLVQRLNTAHIIGKPCQQLAIVGKALLQQTCRCRSMYFVQSTLLRSGTYC